MSRAFHMPPWHYAPEPPFLVEFVWSQDQRDQEVWAVPDFGQAMVKFWSMPDGEPTRQVVYDASGRVVCGTAVRRTPFGSTTDMVAVEPVFEWLREKLPGTFRKYSYMVDELRARNYGRGQ